MRLRRVEAARYGALEDFTLGELGDGLTVVHGPNEAGKSTLTSLVRHVLYRYPTARENEAGYAVGGKGRLARLVFDDANGSWSVERAEGVHGGKVTVRALSGEDRPALLDELTRGVSELAYRTVFGFGLAEMAAIEEQRKSGDSIIGRLYAASAGLRVSPQEIRAALDQEAGELYRASGRKPAVNTLISELRATRSDLRALKAEAESFMEDQARLKVMGDRLDTARAARDAARERATALAVAIERAEEKVAAISADEEALFALRRERKQLQDEADGMEVDASLLAAGPDLDALLDEAAGHTHALQALAENEAALVRAETRASDMLARTGLGASALDLLGDSHECSAAVESARDDLQRLSLQRESRAEAAQRASADAERARSEAARSLGQLGIASDATDEVAERIAALDAVEAARGGGVSARRRSADVLPALILAVSGLVLVVTGAALKQWVFAGIGVMLTVVGAAISLLRRKPTASGDDEGPLLEMLGLNSDAGALEVSRVRRALESARVTVAAVTAAGLAAEEAQRDVQLADDALQTRQALWAEWLAARGLDAGLTPGAASALMVTIREAQAARGIAAEIRSTCEHAREQLDAFAARFAATVRPFADAPDEASRDEVSALANRVKEALAAVRASQARRDEIARAVLASDSHLAAQNERIGRDRADLLDVLARFGLADGGRHEDLRVLHEAARQESIEAVAAYDELAGQANQLEGRLANGAREKRTGELHLEEAGLSERLAEAADRYMVLALASQLVGRAQERYARERQPEVVRAASRLFTTMTGGRYVDLSVPLDEGPVEVFDARAEALTSDILSRGTAEQLYLAIRLGLIAELGEVGAGLPVLMDDVLVNFDPERRRGAAGAIASLASGRQVVFFTCHPDTADLFAEVAPGHVRIDLPRVGS